MTASAYFGFTALDEVAEEMERDRAWARRTGSLWLEALTIQALGLVQAKRGDPRGGEKLIAKGMSMVVDLGMWRYASGLVANWIWYVTDDPVTVEERLRESYDALLEAGEKVMLGEVAASLGWALYLQGRYEEAEAMARVGEETAAVDDIYLQVLRRTVRAKVLARRELFGEAEACPARRSRLRTRASTSMREATPSLAWQTFYAWPAGQARGQRQSRRCLPCTRPRETSWRRSARGRSSPSFTRAPARIRARRPVPGA